MEGMLKIFTENNLKPILERYNDKSGDNWKKITTMLTDIWFACPNLEVGKQLEIKMLEEGNEGYVYFYRHNFPNNTLANMTLGKSTCSLNLNLSSTTFHRLNISHDFFKL
jgi:hypothetical protein